MALPLLAAQSSICGATKKSASDAVVVIDAGHGGHDAGAVDNGQLEKTINLEVAKRLASLINKNLTGVEAVMTRSDDSYLTLQQRADIANKAKGNLFISIHTNSVDKSNKNRNSVCGASVYALGLHKDANNMAVARRENSVIELENDYARRYSGFDPSRDESYIIFELAQKKNLQQSIRFATEAQKQLVAKAGRRDRGVHQAGFWVLWATSMPSVLVELDFICNPEQAEFLGSDDGRDKMAQALFEAVKTFFNTMPDRNAPSQQLQQTVTAATSLVAPTDVVAPAVKPTPEVAVATAKSPETPRSEVADTKTYREAYAQRRRRTASGRQKSENRNVATDEITLHTENERLATPESQTPVAQVVPTDSKLDKKTKKALDKKHKEEEKARKKADKDKKGDSGKVSKVQKFETVYKIQILASKDLLKQNNPRFQGLQPIGMYRENNLYKYTYGESTSKAEMEKLLKDVKAKIPDAFIITNTRQVNHNK